MGGREPPHRAADYVYNEKVIYKMQAINSHNYMADERILV